MAALLALSFIARVNTSTVAAQGQPIVLVPGWNNFGYDGPAEPVPAALAPIAGMYDALWQFDSAAQKWRGYNPSAPESSDFTDFVQGAAYWIHMRQAAVLPVGLIGVIPAAPAALNVGWNNYTQLGLSAPVATVLGQLSISFSVVWHWNAGQQKWEMFDPNAPTASDFQSFVQGQAYFVQVTSTPTPAPASTSCYSFDSYQPQIGEVTDALNRAGNNTLTSDPSFRLADVHTALDNGPQTTPGYVPPTVLKAVAWIESSWRQATYSVSRGSRGRTITSSQCAYGLMQILTGMQISGTPTTHQGQIGGDFSSNAAAGAQMLIAKWNMAPTTLPIYGRRDPHVVEDWYFALWAYHCFGDMCLRYGVHNNPDDPALKWPRPMYASADQQSASSSFTFGDYPYQELIFGRIAFPVVSDGAQLWTAIPVTLPAHGSVGFPTPKNAVETSAHLDNGQGLPVPTPQPTPVPTTSPTPSPTPRAAATASATPGPQSSIIPAVEGD